LRKARICIIDDDADLLAELEQAIGSAGYVTMPFESSIEALKTVSTERPDLILTDLKMPLMSGFQLANELGKNPSTAGIPIVAMTGCFTRDEHKELMRICGIRARLTKPVDPDEILSVIEVLLHQEAGS